MRYFMICDDSGTPIYVDHPDGMLVGLVFNGLDQFLTERDETFSQKFKSMSCGGVLFVAQKYKNLSFLVVSDQGESEMYLRTLLRQIFEHMVMLFGLQVMLEGRYASFTRHKKTIQHIVDTTCALGDRHQAMLVRATERLEVNDRTRGECFNALKNTVQSEKLITHALVFVGTKLLVSYTRAGKAQDIDPSDLLLLITDFHATFHPPDREIKEMELPVADYRDHSNITIRGAQREKTANEQSDIVGNRDVEFSQLDDINISIKEEPHMPDSEFSKISETVAGYQKSEVEYVEKAEPVGQDKKETGTVGLLSDQGHLEHEYNKKEQEDGGDHFELADSDSRLPSLELNNSVIAENSNEVQENSDSILAEAKAEITEEDIKDEDEEFQLHTDEEYDSTKLTKYKALHLRTPRYAPFWVYYAEIGHKTTLVILTSNNPQNGAKGTPDERQDLDVIRDSMRSLLQTYSTYLITKEHTHLPILSFLHQFPGLVHFIFVDRTFNRVIAPSISSLHTMDRPPDDDEKEQNVKRVVKRQVWNMCYQSQQYLSEGVQSLLLKDGPWQFSYRLWVEDVDGFELIFPPEVPFATLHVPQTNKFYQKLMHRFFPTRGNLRCYELFTLYLSTLSAEAVAHHDRDLVALLLNRLVK